MYDMMGAGQGKTEEASDANLPAILANVRDESETFRNVLMPRYREMIDVFRDKMWIAEPETREYFKGLIEFVDVWDKILADMLPRGQRWYGAAQSPETSSPQGRAAAISSAAAVLNQLGNERPWL
jgi:hypothetical protein